MKCSEAFNPKPETACPKDMNAMRFAELQQEGLVPEGPSTCPLGSLLGFRVEEIFFGTLIGASRV